MDRSWTQKIRAALVAAASTTLLAFAADGAFPNEPAGVFVAVPLHATAISGHLTFVIYRSDTDTVAFPGDFHVDGRSGKKGVFFAFPPDVDPAAILIYDGDLQVRWSNGSAEHYGVSSPLKPDPTMTLDKFVKR